MMDLVYVCRSGENEELRYSIRSAFKNLKFNNLWVVGGKPSWYKGLYLEVPQTSRKYINMQKNVISLSRNAEISDNFILMNDDFYIISPVDKVENMNGGRLIDKAKMYDSLSPNSSYTKRLFDTYERLRGKGFEDPIDFELHVPIVINKVNLRHAVKYNLLWRSMYGNIFEIPSIKLEEDVKVYVNSPLDPKSYDIKNLSCPYLSSDDNSFQHVYENVLKSMFPEKSPVEK
jgi:hypothetical protein